MIGDNHMVRRDLDLYVLDRPTLNPHVHDTVKKTKESIRKTQDCRSSSKQVSSSLDRSAR
jgi:hypothetical protein